MATLTLFLVLLFVWLVTRIYARAFATMTPTGQTAVDVVAAVIVAVLLWGWRI